MTPRQLVVMAIKSPEPRLAVMSRRRAPGSWGDARQRPGVVGQETQLAMLFLPRAAYLCAHGTWPAMRENRFLSWRSWREPPTGTRRSSRTGC